MTTNKTWRIHAAGKVFTMIDPAGCTAAEALECIRAKWPDAKLLTSTPVSPAQQPGTSKQGSFFFEEERQ